MALLASSTTTVGPANFELQIRKLSAGLTSSTQLATAGSTFSLAIAPAFVVIEVQWIVDITNLGGVNIVVKRGTLADWSDLAEEANLDIVDTSSPLQTSVGEGPGLALSATSSNGKYLMDTMDVTPLLVGV